MGGGASVKNRSGRGKEVGEERERHARQTARRMWGKSTLSGDSAEGTERDAENERSGKKLGRDEQAKQGRGRFMDMEGGREVRHARDHVEYSEGAKDGGERGAC